jgi:putative ATP-grasp target RiPP
MTRNELAQQGDQFPLGAALGADGSGAQHEEAVPPFGLRYATAASAASVVRVDFSRISYDPVRQIALVADDDDGVVSIRAHSPAAELDWRADQERLSYERIEVPAEIINR